MPAFTTLMNFDVGKSLLQNQDELKRVSHEIEQLLQEFDQKIMYCQDIGLHIYFTGTSSHGTIQGHNLLHKNFVTVDLTEIQENSKSRIFNEKRLQELEQECKTILRSKRVKRLPAIERGGEVQCYFPTTDSKLIEYDFDACIFEKETEFQNIKIMHSPQFGNMLILDNDPNLAESDLIYTETITGIKEENYEGKEVLVLGAGDGGILHELLQVNPKFITMVEIDDAVIEAARKHLRGICYDALDTLEGPNYKVHVDDCVVWLNKFKTEGKMFDVIINDLTAIPVTKNITGDSWNFIKTILELSMAVLKPRGKYYTQGNGANMTDALSMYETLLKSLPKPVDFTRKGVFVPSYHEKWVFYKIWKSNQQNGK